MTALKNHIRPLLFLLAALSPCVAVGEGGFVPTATLVADQGRPLPITPTKLTISGNKAYVIGTADDASQIVGIDAATLEILNVQSLPFTAFDITTSFDGSAVYVIGNQDDATTLLVLSPDLEPLGQVNTPAPMAYPTLKLADSNQVIVAGVLSYDLLGSVVAIDATTPSAPTVMNRLVSVDASFIGPIDAWVDNRADLTVFLNVGFFPTLVAYGLGGKGSTEYGNISFGDNKSNVEPLTITALMPNRLCRGDDTQPSFLIADNASDTLLLAAFDPDFRSLDVLANSEITPVVLPQSHAYTLPGTDIVKPTGLLSTSCNQGVIWLGSLHSKGVEQFAVNPELLSLEKTGDVTLASLPTDIKVSESGGFALVVSAQDNSIMRFQNGDGGVIGTDAARSLQRALTEKGFSVGAIDGLVGAKTLSAVSRFEQRNQIQLDVNRDLEGAVQMIQQLPSN